MGSQKKKCELYAYRDVKLTNERVSLWKQVVLCLAIFDTEAVELAFPFKAMDESEQGSGLGSGSG